MDHTVLYIHQFNYVDTQSRSQLFDYRLDFLLDIHLESPVKAGRA